ncbi:AbrB/MazE/SpoVT family DNA-binding domain-containing protein [Paenibacillus polymyxa]|uniref:AbrB/MazE/SpoVT family DNA-binding domain-containing protein n=1 Tax=Paenibacillus polymyxa TaxID=1406 RepID=UPI0025B6B3CC|nr:AbrB/MazE/SpoVT family DNA-binding domain-containing protein [Paenibacillus polymyxa]MDN4090971.1 AbrB/MazE/SpoVT family DNA-binding domain-containing protein [Paenibacillus polymyxa]
MKSTGMTRPLDALGRIVIPKEMRRVLNYEIGDPIEFFLDKEVGILCLRKYIGVACMLCGSLENLTYFKDSFMCVNCIRELKSHPGSDTLPVTYTATADPVREKTKKRMYHSARELVDELRKLIESDPNASQKEYAKQLGISQGRVSQLKKLL